jgi:Na+-driven multidrug efflux pump
MLRVSNGRELMKTFACFVVPSLSAQLLSGVYTIVDGLFIGMGIGEDGLAAVGLSYPFIMFVTAVGAAIGVGGGALMSRSRGRGNMRLAERILGSMAAMLIAASAIMAVLLSLLMGPAIGLYDVSDRVGGMAYRYGIILSSLSMFQVITMGMLGAVRNDGFPKKAMYIMIFGFAVNILLDWLLVVAIPFGVAGAAYATIVSEFSTAVLLSAHFFSGKSVIKLRPCFVRLKRRICLPIAEMGIPPFGVQAAAALTMIMHNWQALVYGGETGVAAYAVIGCIVPVGVMLQEGVAEGIQPLVSYYCGASLEAHQRLTARLGFIAAVVIGLACAALSFIFRGSIPGLFSMSGQTALVAERGMALSAVMFPFLGIAKVGASYFQSVGNVGRSSLLTYGDPFVMIPLFLWVLPLFFGLDGVWLAMPAANVSLSVVFLFMWKRESYRKIPSVAMPFAA